MVLQLSLDALKLKASTKEIDWKDAAPHPAEKAVITVAVGNTTITWAWHNGKDDFFSPNLFWRTPPLSKEEMDSDSTEVLGRHMPEQCSNFLFGFKRPATKGNAATAGAITNAPAISVYVISSNPEFEKGVQFLFSGISHRMFRLENTDFFTKEQGLYPTLGVDRACALFSALDCDDQPALIFDGGTAWTYSALDAKGKIMGGGISPGIGIRFRALSDYCGRLPFIEAHDFDAAFDLAWDNDSPLPTFASDTKTAMISATVQEVTGQARNIVKQFLQHVKNERRNENSDGEGAKVPPALQAPTTADSLLQPSATSTLVAAPVSTKITGEASTNGNGDTVATANTNAPAGTTGTTTTSAPEAPKETETHNAKLTKKKPTILVTGGDSKYLLRMLESETPQIVSGEPGVTLPIDQFEIKDSKHLIHYGVGRLLQKKVSENTNPTEDDLLRAKILGLRVAVEFPTPDASGDNIYRGSVVDFRRGNNFEEDLYLVRYDDGDSEWLDITRIYGSLKLFVEKGEKQMVDQQKYEEKNKEGSKKHADEVLARSEVVRKFIASEEEKKKGESAKRKNSAGVENVSKKSRTAKVDPLVYVGHRVCKMFPLENEEGIMVDVLFYGTITEYDAENKLWQVVYDDDDQEDFDERDMKTAVRLYDENKPGDPKLAEGSAPATNGST